MQQTGQWSFEVAPGEQITFRVVPRETQAKSVGVWLDKQKLSSVSQFQPYDEYAWTAPTGSREKQVLMLECNFSAAAPETARYDFWIIGSETGREFLCSVARKDGKNQDIDIEFVVMFLAMAGPPAAEEDVRDIRTAAAPPQELPGEGAEDRLDMPTPPAGNGGAGTSAVSGIEPGRPGAGKDATPRNWKKAKPPLRILAELAPPDKTVLDAPRKLKFAGEASSRAGKKSSSKRFARPVGKQTRSPEGAGKGSRKKSHKKVLSPDKRIVNVGFASDAESVQPLPPTKSLICGKSYYFWLKVGELIAESLEAETPVALPVKQLPVNALLKVVLFTFADGLEIENSAAVGELTLQADGSVVITRQVVEPKGKVADKLKGSLFFPVRAPARSGKCKLRCSIYYEQVLVQSRLIEARVERRAAGSAKVIRSTVDYTLTRTINPAHLSGMGPHRLSIMLNDNGNGAMGLRFFGEKDFKSDADFDGQALQDLIRQARGTLRIAAWGDRDAWSQEKKYRYNGVRDFNRLKADLVQMAKKGYAFYSNIIDKFTGGPKQSDDLAALMKTPGRVQIALKESARHVIPAALLYDYPLDNGLNDADYKICAAFQKAFNANRLLEGVDCFNGRCPVRDDLDVVCPSGFWGFRHYMGMPLSMAEAPDAPTAIDWQGSPHLALAVSTDLEQRDAHVKVLNALKPGWIWDYADTRDAALALMKEKKPHLVYFYCHGGLADNEPYIKVGPKQGPRLTEALLRARRILWDLPRPLVFINGCHTTALEPDQALEFVSSFVRIAHAAGVIGTEITVFEPLAQKFAESFLRKFVVEGKSIGESMRSARLALLANGNPLGLAYVPYAIASMQMVEQAAAVQQAAVGKD